MFNSSSSTQDVVELRCRSTIDLTHPDHIAKATNFEHTSHSEHNDDQSTVCFVCGNVGKFLLYPVRIRLNPARLAEPYFPFLETHEPPAGLPPITPTQTKVQACVLCHKLLHEQWLVFENEHRPQLQRLYFLKRVDGRVSIKLFPYIDFVSLIAKQRIFIVVSSIRNTSVLI